MVDVLSARTQIKILLSRLGPGLLYAGAAVGVSHLVQSTRAGAEYGWWPALAVVFIHAAKYPFFKIGPRFAAARGKSLVAGYREVGRGALAVFVLFTLGTMFAVIAAITSVTTGIAMYVFGIEGSPAVTAAVILTAATAVLLSGKYNHLERLMKWMVLILTVSTAVVFLTAFFKGGHGHPEAEVQLLDGVFLIMMVKLMGWMPAPLDLSVWHSLWALEKRESSADSAPRAYSRIDFETGYWGTMVIGILFLGLGTLFFYGSEKVLPDSGTEFAKTLLRVYADDFGGLAFAVISAAALATMLSTTLTVLDAIPRSLSEAWRISKLRGGNLSYLASLIVLAAGAGALLSFRSLSMTAVVDLATVLSFTSTPVLAYLNLRAAALPMAGDASLSKGARIYAYGSLFVLTGLAAAYFWAA